MESLRFADGEGQEQPGSACQEGYRKHLKSPQRDQYHGGKTRHGKSPKTRSKPLGPSFAAGKKHQRQNGRGHASPDPSSEGKRRSEPGLPEPKFTGREGAAEGGTIGFACASGLSSSVAESPGSFTRRRRTTTGPFLRRAIGKAARTGRRRGPVPTAGPRRGLARGAGPRTPDRPRAFPARPPRGRLRGPSGSPGIGACIVRGS